MYSCGVVDNVESLAVGFLPVEIAHMVLLPESVENRSGLFGAGDDGTSGLARFTRSALAPNQPILVLCSLFCGIGSLVSFSWSEERPDAAEGQADALAVEVCLGLGEEELGTSVGADAV